MGGYHICPRDQHGLTGPCAPSHDKGKDKMKKFLTGITTAAMLMGSAAYAETTLKLVEVITSPERTKVLQGIVDGYEAANPDVTV